jgi:hypothetical protein
MTARTPGSARHAIGRCRFRQGRTESGTLQPMNFVLGLLVGGGVGWFLGRQKMEWQIVRQQAMVNRHVAHGYFSGVKAPTPGPPPPPPPGACPNDMMWDPVNQECVPVLPWPIQQ